MILIFLLAIVFPFLDRSLPGVQCCSQDFSRRLPPEITSPACSPVDVPVNDYFYSQYNVKCLNYIRSETSLPESCAVGAFETVNGVTHFADLSIIYGSTPDVLSGLRAFSGGEMKTNDFNVLPEIDGCDGTGCYRLGAHYYNAATLHTVLYKIFFYLMLSR